MYLFFKLSTYVCSSTDLILVLPRQSLEFFNPPMRTCTISGLGRDNFWTQFLSAFTLETLTFVQFSQDIFTLVALLNSANTSFRRYNVTFQYNFNTISHLRAFIWYTDSWFPGTKKSPFDLVVWKKAKKVFLITMNTKVAPSAIKTKSCFSFFNADLVRCLH